MKLSTLVIIGVGAYVAYAYRNQIPWGTTTAAGLPTSPVAPTPSGAPIAPPSFGLAGVPPAISSSPLQGMSDAGSGAIAGTMVLA